MVHEEDAVADVAEAEEDEVIDVAEAEEDTVTHVAEAEEEYRTPHAQPSAQADAGGHVDNIVRQMEIDDLTARAEEDSRRGW